MLTIEMVRQWLAEAGYSLVRTDAVNDVDVCHSVHKHIAKVAEHEYIMWTGLGDTWRVVNARSGEQKLVQIEH